MTDPRPAHIDVAVCGDLIEFEARAKEQGWDYAVMLEAWCARVLQIDAIIDVIKAVRARGLQPAPVTLNTYRQSLIGLVTISQFLATVGDNRGLVLPPRYSPPP